MSESINGVVFSSMLLSAAAAIENHKSEINELNVFPVPDGDTGTNMSMTMRAGANSVANTSKTSLGIVAETAANALLRGARGNSGVILSLLFRGISRELKDQETANATDIAQALACGVEAAYKAVMKPTEGTILTVSRFAAGAAAQAAEAGGNIDAVLEAASESGWMTVTETMSMNPVLKKAGVVDAGGKGFMYILDGMISALRGEPVIPNEIQDENSTTADFSNFSSEDITFTYCTEFIAKHESSKSPELLRDFLSKRGDSIVLVYDNEIIKTHVHTNEPGVILTEALTYGQLLTVKIENMREQHTAKVINAEEKAKEEDNSIPVTVKPQKKFGIVTVCAGEGLEALFKDIGVDAIVSGGQTMNPSTEDILKMIETVPADTVFVLPNNKNIVMAAQQCIAISSKNVIVIQTGTVPQGISAALAMVPEASIDDNTKFMTEAASNVHTAQITYAARESDFDGLNIKAGQYLALLDGSLVTNSESLEVTSDSLAVALKQFEPNVITIYYGCDATDSMAQEIVKSMQAIFPDADIMTVPGGQPVYYFIISAEIC